MIDTHTHLYADDYAGDGGGEAAVRRAMTAGVGRMIFPNIDVDSIGPLETLANRFPGTVYKAMGLHPTEVKDTWRDDLYAILGRFDHGHEYVAVGEVGIDLYWDKSRRTEQMEVFNIQAARAVELDLPLIIHCREGLPEVLEVLGGHPGARAVFHSFGGDAADVEAIRRCGDYYFGINGIVTFKKATVKDVLPVIGTERLLLETDAPWLAPVPYRGKRNESAFLPYTATFIADAMGLTAEEIDRVTTANAERLFRL